jgi:hypothetical protein
LQAGVYFHKIKIAVFVQQELNRAHPDIAGGFGQVDRGLFQFFP